MIHCKKKSTFGEGWGCGWSNKQIDLDPGEHILCETKS